MHPRKITRKAMMQSGSGQLNCQNRCGGQQQSTVSPTQLRAVGHKVEEAMHTVPLCWMPVLLCQLSDQLLLQSCLACNR